MDTSTVVALVWAWLAEHPEHYCSFVNAHTQLRWSPLEKKLCVTRVGGHWRRLACWAKVVPALGCVCRFERLVKPKTIGAPPSAYKERWERGTGDFIPQRYRVLVFA